MVDVQKPLPIERAIFWSLNAIHVFFWGGIKVDFTMLQRYFLGWTFFWRTKNQYSLRGSFPNILEILIDGDLFSVEDKTASYSIKRVVDLPSHPSQNTCDFLRLILSDFGGFIPSKELFENPIKFV